MDPREVKLTGYQLGIYLTDQSRSYLHNPNPRPTHFQLQLFVFYFNAYQTNYCPAAQWENSWYYALGYSALHQSHQSD